jgi:hypothetical protein
MCLDTHNGDGVFANVLKPNELQGAWTVTVNPLSLVGADDNVFESSTGVEVEHGVLPIAFRLAVAGARATVVLGPPGVKDLSRCDLNHGAIGMVSGGGRNSSLVPQTCQSDGNENGERRNA